MDIECLCGFDREGEEQELCVQRPTPLPLAMPMVFIDGVKRHAINIGVIFTRIGLTQNTRKDFFGQNSHYIKYMKILFRNRSALTVREWLSMKTFVK